MPNVTIYLDHELAERVRRTRLPVSRVCQQALRLALAEDGSDYYELGRDGDTLYRIPFDEPAE